jgi:hypothetical protein
MKTVFFFAEASLLFTDLDFLLGLSGGPLFNEAGEVVSLASTVRHDPKVSPFDGYTITTSYGPCFSQLKKVFK